LLVPQRNLITADTTPTFQWQPVTGATKYTFEIKDRYTNAVIVKNTYSAAARCDAVECTIPSPVTLSHDDYKWHVLSRTDSEKGAWSVWWNLTIGTVSLQTPSLQSPGANAAVFQSTPILQWSPVDYAIEYRVRVKDALGILLVDELLPCAVCKTPGGLCEFPLPFDLGTDYGLYSWQVQAKNGGFYSTWTTWRNFIYTRIAAVLQNMPANGQGGLFTDRPVFGWSVVDGAEEYQLQIRNGSGTVVIEEVFSAAAACSGLTCETQTTEALPDTGTYSWHVRGKNGRNFGYWSAWWSFTTDK
jgi:hypothetical protein